MKTTYKYRCTQCDSEIKSNIPSKVIEVKYNDKKYSPDHYKWSTGKRFYDRAQRFYLDKSADEGLFLWNTRKYKDSHTLEEYIEELCKEYPHYDDYISYFKDKSEPKEYTTHKATRTLLLCPRCAKEYKKSKSS